MSTLDNGLLLSDLEERLNEYLPVNAVKRVLADATDVLANYTVSLKSLTGGGGAEGENNQLIQLFLDAKRIEGKSEKTIERYKYVLGRLDEAVHVSFRKLTVYHLRQYMMEEKDRGVAMSTLKGNSWVYSGFFDWLFNEGLIPKNPTVNLGAIKANPEQEPPLTDAELQLVKEACKNDKERAVVYFLMATGCRISEMCAVNRSGVDFQNRRLKVHGKGDKYRMVYFDEVTEMMLRRYLSTRTDIDPALFYSRNKRRFTPSGIQEMLRKIGDRAHVPGVHPHRFRHTFATNLVDRGMEIQEVSALLGHAKLDTTMVYVTVNQRNTENSYRKYAAM